MKPTFLDLFCGAGLVARGLIAAGCNVVGVDINPQPNYPGPFLRHDAVGLDYRFLDMFHFIWASPPCQKETVMRSAPGAKGDAHPDWITPTQQMLDRWAARTGGKFAIENVANTKRLRHPIILCGSMFGLGVTDGGRRFHLERHRKIETNWPLLAPSRCAHVKPCVGCYGDHARVRSSSAGGRKTSEFWTRPHREIMSEAMGVPRAGLEAREMSEGVPPAYSEYVARSLFAHLATSSASPVLRGDRAA